MKFRLVTIFLVILVFLLGTYTGSSMYSNDKDQNISRNLPAYLDKDLSWNNASEGLNVTKFNNDTDYNSSYVRTKRLQNIFYKTLDAFGFSLTEFTKIAIEFGYESQGEYKASFVIGLLQFFLWAIIIGLLFFPMIAVGVIIYEGIRYTKKHINKYRNNRGKNEVIK